MDGQEAVKEAALSCYYSGNFTTGGDGYVRFIIPCPETKRAIKIIKTRRPTRDRRVRMRKTSQAVPKEVGRRVILQWFSEAEDDGYSHPRRLGYQHEENIKEDFMKKWRLDMTREYLTLFHSICWWLRYACFGCERYCKR